MRKPGERDGEHHPMGTRARLGCSPEVVWGWGRPGLVMPGKRTVVRTVTRNPGVSWFGMG